MVKKDLTGRNQIITILVRKEDKEQLQEIAEREFTTVSSYVRQKVMLIVRNELNKNK